MRFADILQQYAYGLIQNNTHFIATFGNCHLVYSDNELYELDTENRKWNLSVNMLQLEFLNRTFIKQEGEVIAKKEKARRANQPIR